MLWCSKICGDLNCSFITGQMSCTRAVSCKHGFSCVDDKVQLCAPASECILEPDQWLCGKYIII